MRFDVITKRDFLSALILMRLEEEKIGENDLLFITVEKIEGSPTDWIQKKFFGDSEIQKALAQVDPNCPELKDGRCEGMIDGIPRCVGCDESTLGK